MLLGRARKTPWKPFYTPHLWSVRFSPELDSKGGLPIFLPEGLLPQFVEDQPLRLCGSACEKILLSIAFQVISESLTRSRRDFRPKWATPG